MSKKVIDPHKPLEISFHVLPTDLDLNLHMNNARYASFMDITRVQFIVQTPIYKKMKQLGSVGVLGTSYFRYRRGLKLFDKFTVKVQVVYLSPRWIYLDYKFIKDGFVFCHAMEKFGASLPSKGMVPPHELIPPVPGAKDFPKPPPHIIKIMETEDEMRQLIPKNEKVES